MDFSTGLILTCLFCVISFWILWRKRRMNLLERYAIPGPKPNFWTGNLNEFLEKRDDCVNIWRKKYGDFIGFYLGANPYIICYDVQFLKIMQIKEFKNFTNKNHHIPDAGVPSSVVFKALEVLHDEDWKNLRSFLSPCFSTAKLKTMSQLTTNPIGTFMKKIEEQKETFDIFTLFQKLTFDINCRAVFGIEANLQNDETDKLIESIKNVLSGDFSDTLNKISLCFPECEPIPTKLKAAIDWLKSLLNLPCMCHIVQTCREIIESRRKSKHRSVDLLQTMIDGNNTENEDGKKYVLSDEYLISNAFVFMVAGNDTIYGTLGYCTYLLSLNPDAQERIRKEINENVKQNEEIDYNAITNFKYLDQVISETLRLYPLTLLSINRRCAEDFKYKDLTIPKGATVVVPVSVLQRDPAYWSNPEELNPERWSEDAVNKLQRKLLPQWKFIVFSPENRKNADQLIYQPFGAGPRICIGQRMAQTIMKLVLSNLVRSYKLEYGKKEKELEIEQTLFFTRPKDGIQIRVMPLKTEEIVL